tara:strand:- start:279 stop:767 length:489 start_codon:yes stop_codon:yes gene_type:complete
MTIYLGTKIIDAIPMNRLKYNKYRGWSLPADENGADEGYLVEYLDGGSSNHLYHEGYISWSPKDVFETSYKVSGNLTFGHAVELLKTGKKVSRAGWNGKDMFVFLVQGSKFTVNRAPLLGIYPEGTVITYNSHMDLKGADGSVSTWAPSGSDALAEDWGVVK